MTDKFLYDLYKDQCPPLKFKDSGAIGNRVVAYVQLEGKEQDVAYFIKGQTLIDLCYETNFLTYEDLVMIKEEMEKYL